MISLRTVLALFPATFAAVAVPGISGEAGSPAEFMPRVPTGYTATLFAKPPMVSYPVQICTTATGEVFVTCDGNGAQGSDPKRGRIVRLVDADGDGVAERADLFVADIDTPRGIAWDGASLYCLHPPNPPPTAISTTTAKWTRSRIW